MCVDVNRGRLREFEWFHEGLGVYLQTAEAFHCLTKILVHIPFSPVAKLKLTYIYQWEQVEACVDGTRLLARGSSN